MQLQVADEGCRFGRLDGSRISQSDPVPRGLARAPTARLQLPQDRDGPDSLADVAQSLREQMNSQICVNGVWQDCFVNDLSPGGAEIAAIGGVNRGTAVQFNVPGHGEVSGQVVRVTEKSNAIRFDLDDQTREELEQRLCGVCAAA